MTREEAERLISLLTEEEKQELRTFLTYIMRNRALVKTTE